MNARGTRRPHVRRPHRRPVKIRKSGKGGCAVVVAALAGGLLTAAETVWWLIA